MQRSIDFYSSAYWIFQSLRQRNNIKKYLEKLNETQYLSEKSLQDFQFKKLHQVFENASMNIPYYKKYFKESNLNIKNFDKPEDIKKFPILNRNILLTHNEELISTINRQGVFTNYSSGSTGQRAKFKQDLEFTNWSTAHQLRTYNWCGDWKLGEPFVLIWGSPTYWEMHSWDKKIGNFISNRYELNSFELSQVSIKNMLKKLLEVQPVLISGYTTALYMIAKVALEKTIVFSRLRSVQPNAEALLPEMREVIERGFNVPVYDKYGSRETNIIAHETPNHQELYIQSENVFVEFLNEKNEWCKPNEIGRIVVTTLNNHVMPLIRYETGDLASPIKNEFDSSFGFPKMSKVKGREHDIIITPNNGKIHPQFFSNLFMRSPFIEWFQVIQNDKNILNISIFVPKGIPKSEIKKLTNKIHKFTKYPFEVLYTFLDTMPDSKTGKFRLCICNIK